MERYSVFYSGNVQGVGFRMTTVNVARAYDVAGYVKNLPDGRVELVAEGEKQALDAFLAEVQRVMGSYIRNTDVHKGEAMGEFGKPGEPGVFGVTY